MTKTTQGYYETLTAMHVELAETYAILNAKQSELDREVSAIYHDIERLDLDVESGYRAAKCLQDTLRRRRVVKDEFIRVSALTRQIASVLDSYRKTDKNSRRICRELNVTMTISDVM